MRTANPTKTRKPYKITKPRERWNEQEHEKFLEAIDKFGRDWKQVVTFIGTRSVSQVRSHAQKHFIRLEKKGLGDVVPPARRKARWAEKQSAGLCDNPSESDQDFSALHQQASSSSVSTFEHQAMHPLLGAAQNLDGRGSSIDYSECQPLSSRTHSLGSLASRNTSFTSPASQTEFITYAQEMLLHRQDAPATTSASAGNASAFNAQPLQPEQRQFIVDMLQQLAAHQQAAGLSSAPLGVEGLPGNDAMQTQQRIRQLLQQQQHQQGGLQSGSVQSGGVQEGPLMGTHLPSIPAQVDTWPWGAHATAPTAAPSSNVSSDHVGFSPEAPSVAVSESLPAFGQQPATPRLDGAFLAECFRSPRLAAAHNLAFQNITSQSVASQNLMSQNLPSQNLPIQNFASQNSPNASMASTAHCYPSSSSPRLSCHRCLPTTKAEPLQHSHMTYADEAAPLGAPLDDALGLEDVDFWGGIGFEDPLIQAVEAAMGCTDESENSCFNMTTEF